MNETLRDQIWNTAIEALVESGKFKTSTVLEQSDLRENQRQTVLRTLRTLEKKGWVDRDSCQATTWRLGWKGNLMLDVTEETIENSKH